MELPTPFSCRVAGADPQVVSVYGEIDLASAPKLRRLLGQVIDSGERYVAIDLGFVEFMDSTGIRVLLEAFERLRGTGGELMLRAVSAPVEKVLKLAGVDRVLGVPRATQDPRRPLRSSE